MLDMIAVSIRLQGQMRYNFTFTVNWNAGWFIFYFSKKFKNSRYYSVVKTQQL